MIPWKLRNIFRLMMLLLDSFRNRGLRLSADLRIKGQAIADAAHQQREVLFAFFWKPDHAKNDTVVDDLHARI